jgi:hypothetical protein
MVHHHHGRRSQPRLFNPRLLKWRVIIDRVPKVIAAQGVFILLSYTLRQWQLWKFRQQDLAGKTPGLLGRQLNLHSEQVVIYYQNAYTRMPLLTFSRELLELPAQARARALKRLRHLEQSFLTPLENLRAPP